MARSVAALRPLDQDEVGQVQIGRDLIVRDDADQKLAAGDEERLGNQHGEPRRSFPSVISQRSARSQAQTSERPVR